MGSEMCIRDSVIQWIPNVLVERGAGISELGLPFVSYDADAAR